MPHKKMTAFTALTTVAADDIMIVDDTSAVETKKVTLENLLSVINVLTAEATIDGAADYVAVWDTSAAAIRKALPNNLPVPTGALKADGSVPLTANWDAGAFEIRAQTFQSDVATGTAPIIVASTTVVANLNADKVDGTDVNDAGSTTSDLWTASKIQAVVDAAVAGLYDHKGAYNASTNSPDLDTSPSGVLKGDAYTVSVAGTFFTAAVDAGDVLIADQDSPTLESHWTIVNRNIDETAFATASHTHTASDITDFSEAVDDRAAALVVGGTDITVTYDDGAGTLTIDSTAGGGSTLPVVDTTGIAKGSVDATKIVRLEVDGLTTGTTRVLTVQDADGTIELTGHSHAASNITSGTLAHERGGLEADVSAYAGVPLIDSGITSELKYDLAATTDPTVNDDSNAGYSVGSRKVNVVLDKEFVCLDASPGAAVWSETSHVCCSGSGSEAIKAVADGATVTVDQHRGDDFKVTLGGNRTLALSNPTIGQSVLLRVIQDGTGSRTLSYPASVKWPNGTAPTLTTTANASDWLGFKCIDAATPVYHGFIVGQGYSA
jgi:hypothetical protein